MRDSNILPLTLKPGPAPAPALLSAENLVYRRGGRDLLAGVNLHLAPEGITALLGPNGAGKSLTLRILMGLIAPDSGQVRFDPAFAGPIGMVFQKPVLLRRSVRGILDHALRVDRVARRIRTGRIAELLVLAGLTHCAESAARALSGGEQQRLALARALAPDPKLLLLDEPTASLDPAATAKFEDLTRKVAASGTRIVLVTHDLQQARRMAGDVIFLHQGRVCEHSPAAQFFRNPISAQARAYCTGTLLT